MTNTCTLASKPFGDPARWIKRAKEFAKVDPKKTWTTIYVGLAYHRAGRWTEAMNILNESNKQQTNPLLTVQNYALLAANFKRLDPNAPAAATTLQTADRLRARLPTDVATRDWPNWIACEALCAEAERLLRAAPAGGK